MIEDEDGGRAHGAGRPDEAESAVARAAGSRLVFIGGVHRSGTSLVHRVLSAQPAFSGFSNTGVPEDEGQHLQDVYPPAKALGGPGSFGFNQESYMDESHPLATQENAVRLLDCWMPYWDGDKEFLLEKSPPNLVRGRFLQKLFPGCAFVIVMRHPIAVAYATLKWSRTGIPNLIEHTLACYERFLVDAPHLKRVYVVRYEDLVRSPQICIGALLDWLGAGPLGADAVPVRSGLNERYFARWAADRHSPIRLLGRVRGLRTRLPELEARANALGYALDPPGELRSIRLPHEPPATGDGAPGAAEV